jgi:prepilin-type N-terminal cleavage/methylation domain-containing protein
MNKAVLPQTHEKGFSMLELMVVLVIISILGSFAVPAYQDYMVKAKVMEFFALAQPAKLAVTEALINGKALTDISHETLGLEKIENIGSLKSLLVNQGVIQIVGNGTALGLSDDANVSVDLTPKKSGAIIQWECTTTAPFKKYAPNHCTIK